MAKEYDNKRKIAHHYYVEKNYTAKQVAEMLDITPKTVGEWVRKYAWKQERQAREISVRSREENRDQVLSDLATDRRRIRELIMEQEASPQPDRELIRELRKQISRIGEQVEQGTYHSTERRAGSTGHLSTGHGQYFRLLEALRYGTLYPDPGFPGATHLSNI